MACNVCNSAMACSSEIAISSQVFLYSALSNVFAEDSKPYPTARSPGAAPISHNQFTSDRTRAQAQVRTQEEEPAVSSCAPSSSGDRMLRSGRVYSRSDPLPSAELHLTTRLADNVFLGG